MFKKFFCAAALAVTVSVGVKAADYGLPAGIQEGNILHCFDWTCAQVEAELDNIAKAGFGSVQLSPMQGNCNAGAEWYYAYMPYDFTLKGSGVGSKAQLTSLCAAAHQRGIKVIVDVVANHVNKASGYHDTWWDSNGRVRWNGSINYGDRSSITHGQLGDYGDVNSEDAQVQARAKAYVEELKACGVDGIRWDAAKHIGLPSEGCNFWSTVTSVPGMWHYGEILDSPGGNADAVMKEYTKYMSVTDNGYCDGVRNAIKGGGAPSGYAGWAANTIADTKVVYWAESHDDYSNEWQATTHIPQAVIDRTWAIVACRNGASSLYLSRPAATNKDAIKMGVKGSTHFTSAEIAAINKLRNTAVGHADYYSSANGVVCVTRKDVGAAIIKGNGQAGSVSVANGGGYCPAGTYIDQVSGSTFTVTASTISGNVGSTGIAVLIKDGAAPNPDPDPNPGPDPVPTPASMYILGNLSGAAGWSTTPGTGFAMTQSGSSYTAAGVEFKAAAGETKCYFNLTDYVGSTWDDLNMSANRYGAATEGEAVTLGKTSKVVAYLKNVDASGCLSWTIAPGKYDITFDSSAMTLLVNNAGDNPTPDPDPVPTPDPDADHYIYFDGTFSQPQVWAWNASGNCTTATAWPGDNMVKKNNMWYWEVPAGKSLPAQIIIHEGDNKIGGGDLKYVDKATYHQNGTYTENGDNPNPGPDPDPSATVTIAGDYNLAYSGSHTNVYYWGATNPVTWDAAPAMESATGSDGNTYKVCKLPEGMTHVIFKTGSAQTADLTYTSEYVMNDNGATSTKVVFGNTPVPAKPTVAISPNGGKVKGTATISVTIAKATSVTADFNGKALSLSNGTNTVAVSSYLNDGQTGTLTVKATNADGATEAEATFTRSDAVTPVPVGNNLITDYYKVNPDGHYGSNRTVNMQFSSHNATGALSHWSDDDLIAQGVARDVAQAMKGNHERPVIDSYAIYAAYDKDNLYLGVQFVYTVWDFYGEGKQPGESKPYNMDGHMIIAFDLDPDKSFDGYIDGKGAIWNDVGAPGAKFENGVDAVWMGSTKPGVGTPGLFVPTPDGHASYNAPYCKASTVKYGYADGLASCINSIWGQKELNFDASVLEGNDGFVDLRSEIDDSAHTFYEFCFPLSLLGVTEDYIRTNGIGVQYIDKYGSSPVGGTPYDPSFFDNVTGSYSQDPSSSEEKEDEDIITYAPARIGHASFSGVEDITLQPADDEAPAVYYNLQGMRVDNPANGIYIKRQGSKATKVMVR